MISCPLREQVVWNQPQVLAPNVASWGNEYHYDSIRETIFFRFLLRHTRSSSLTRGKGYPEGFNHALGRTPHKRRTAEWGHTLGRTPRTATHGQACGDLAPRMHAGRAS